MQTTQAKGQVRPGQAARAGQNPKTGDHAKRHETPGSKKKGEFMDNKEGGKPFECVAKEPDRRRK